MVALNTTGHTRWRGDAAAFLRRTVVVRHEDDRGGTCVKQGDVGIVSVDECEGEHANDTVEELQRAACSLRVVIRMARVLEESQYLVTDSAEWLTRLVMRTHQRGFSKGIVDQLLVTSTLQQCLCRVPVSNSAVPALRA